MAYDVTLVQFNGVIGGMITFSLVGIPNGLFDYLLCSFWVCLPAGGAEGCDVGPFGNFFNALPSSSNGGQFTLSLTNDYTVPHATVYEATFDVPPLRATRSNILLSVDCATQTVQLYVNDAAYTATSGGWLVDSPHMGQSGGLAGADMGSLGGVYPAMADLWWNLPIAFFDLSITSNRRKFINADLSPVYLGPTGAEPTGSPPLVYCTVTGTGPSDFLTNYGTGGSFRSEDGVTFTFQTPGTCTLPVVLNVAIDGVEATAEVGDITGFHELSLVSLYPMDAAASNVYALENINGADFPSSFSQFSLSVWCCEDVNIRGPNGIDANYSFNLDFKPASASLMFKDASGDTLFSGTFTNPGTPTNLYHVMFSIDTEAQTYTFWVSSGAPAVQWVSTNAAFGVAGSINNVGAT